MWFAHVAGCKHHQKDFRPEEVRDRTRRTDQVQRPNQVRSKWRGSASVFDFGSDFKSAAASQEQTDGSGRTSVSHHGGPSVRERRGRHSLRYIIVNIINSAGGPCTVWWDIRDHYFLLQPSGSVHYDEGESEAESMTSNMDMSNPIFQLYEAVRGARNSQGQLISEPFLQLPSRKDYPDYYQQTGQPICLHQIK